MESQRNLTIEDPQRSLWWIPRGVFFLEIPRGSVDSQRSWWTPRGVFFLNLRRDCRLPRKENQTWQKIKGYILLHIYFSFISGWRLTTADISDPILSRKFHDLILDWGDFSEGHPRWSSEDLVVRWRHVDDHKLNQLYGWLGSLSKYKRENYQSMNRNFMSGETYQALGTQLSVVIVNSYLGKHAQW